MSSPLTRGHIYQEIFLIAPMVTYLGFGKDFYQRINPTDEELLGGEQDRHYYMCKHFNEKMKVCSIYEHRPPMCRDYPYRSECNYAGCTWKEKKARKLTAKQNQKRKRELKSSDLKKVGKW